jgi:hypothetical protein
MKTYLKLTIMIFAVVLMVSCEEEITVLQPLESGHVQLQTDANVSVPENDEDGASFEVQLGITSNAEGYTANFEVTSDDDTRYTVTPSNGEIYFAPNTYEASITIVPVDNIKSDGSVKVTITLTDDNAGVYANDELNSVELTITDNDCPTVIAEEYTAEVYLTVSGTVYGPKTHTVTPVEIPGMDNTYYIANLWGTDYINWAFGYTTAGVPKYAYETLLTIEEDMSVTFTPQNTAGLTYGGQPDPIATGGTGTYAACDDKWTLYPEDDYWFITANGYITTVILTSE